MVIDVVEKISYSMIMCSALVLGEDVQVTREDDVVIDADGKISHSIVWCSAFVLWLQMYR